MAAMTRAIDRMASSVDFYRSPSASFCIDASMPAWLQTRFTTGLFCSYRRLDCSPPGVCYCYAARGMLGHGKTPLFYRFGNCELDTSRRELRCGGDRVALRPQVFDLVEYLIRNHERVVSKDELIANVWAGRMVSESAITTRINAARRAVGDSGEQQRLIKTVLRKGFRFVGAVRAEKAPAGVTAHIGTVTSGPVLALPDKPSIAVLPF